VARSHGALRRLPLMERAVEHHLQQSYQRGLQHVANTRLVWPDVHRFAASLRTKTQTPPPPPHSQLPEGKAEAFASALEFVSSPASSSSNKTPDIAGPPVTWTPHDAFQFCTQCGCDFHWNSTFSSLAKNAMCRHNCRACGALVCEGCSSHTVPLPALGLMFPERVCDSCFSRSELQSAEGLLALVRRD